MELIDGSGIERVPAKCKKAAAADSGTAAAFLYGERKAGIDKEKHS